MEQKERGMIKRLFDILGRFNPFMFKIHMVFVVLVTYMILMAERHTGWQSCFWSYLIGLACGFISVFIGLFYGRRPG